MSTFCEFGSSRSIWRDREKTHKMMDWIV